MPAQTTPSPLVQVGLQLLKELPLNAHVAEYSGTQYTAGEMIALLQKNDYDALSWVSDLLRVSRDLIARKHSEIKYDGKPQQA